MFPSMKSDVCVIEIEVLEGFGKFGNRGHKNVRYPMASVEV